jgi:uncharacterized protein (DUF1697 family)
MTNQDLRSLFVEMGFQAVATFRASGNVVFDAEDRRASDIAVRIEEELSKSLGYEVPTFLRTAAQVRAIADHEPFDPELIAASKGKLQVAMLPARPTKPKRSEVLALATNEDKLAIRDRELYWLPSGGTLDSALDLNTVARVLGPWTMRTKGTVDQIAAKHFGA